MIIFLYGENSYLSSQKLKSIKKKYVDASLGDTNLCQLEAKGLDYSNYNSQIKAMPFLAKTRLVVVKDLIGAGSKKLQEKIIENIKEVPKTTTIIFFESVKVDKRSKIFKILFKEKSQEFKNLSELELKNWTKNKLKKSLINYKVDFDYLTNIILNNSSNMWRIENQIEKVCLYIDSNEGNIDSNEINLLIEEGKEEEIFSFLDTLLTGRKEYSYRKMHKIISSGENPIYIMSMINYQMRNMIICKQLLDQGVTQYSLAKKARLNPFVVRKIVSNIDKFGLDKLRGIYKQLLEFDVDLKSGKINQMLAVDMIVEKICG